MSAEAARNTSALIEESVQRAEGGARLAREVSGQLDDIQARVATMTDVVQRIAHASVEQDAAIVTVRATLVEMSGLVQDSAAHSEESAAAAQELTSQAQAQLDLVGSFRVAAADPAVERRVVPESSTPRPAVREAMRAAPALARD
jgi:methyl-accepting chemotaxis protein